MCFNMGALDREPGVFGLFLHSSKQSSNGYLPNNEGAQERRSSITLSLHSIGRGARKSIESETMGRIDRNFVST